MNSIIPDKLKEELEDVGKVYNSRSGVCVYPNAFSRLQTEIMKVCNKNKNLEAQIEKMKQDLDNARESANKQEQWEIYSVLNDIYNDNFEVITSVSN